MSRAPGRPVKDLSDYPLYHENESVRRWLDTLSPRSQKNYLSDLPYFLEWLKQKDTESFEGITPDRLLETRIEDLKQTDERDRHRFEDLAATYYRDIKPSMAPWTSAARLKAVQSFFKRNWYPLTFQRGHLKVTRRKNSQKVIPTNEEIRLMYKQASPGRNRALLLFMYQCGLTPIDVSSLDIESVLKVLENEPPVYFWIMRHKTGQIQETCLTADLVYDVKNMLRLRGQSEKGPLFIGRTGKRLSPQLISQVVKNITRKAEVRQFKPKNLRDAYKDALDEAAISEDVKKLMMGHAAATSGLYGSLHSGKRARIIVEAYGKVLKNLAVDGETGQPRLSHAEVEDLQDRVNLLEDTVRELLRLRKLRQEATEEETEDLREEIDLAKEAIKELLESHKRNFERIGDYMKINNELVEYIEEMTMVLKTQGISVPPVKKTMKKKA